jgi:hypothetical protein
MSIVAGRDGATIAANWDLVLGKPWDSDRSIGHPDHSLL